MKMRPRYAVLAASVLLIGAASIATVVATRSRSPGRAAGELSATGALKQTDAQLYWSPGVDELASLGCELLLEPHYVRLVQSTRSLPLIVQLPTIRTVHAFGESLGSELENLAYLPELEHLYLRRCALPDSLDFLGQLSSLRVLCIASSNLTDEDLRNVRLTMPLRTLDLSFNDGISERGMKSFLNVSSLRRLDLTSTGVARLDFLDRMSELEELSLGQTRIGDEDMSFLVGLENLQKLELFGTRITDSATDAIANIESLQLLDIRYTEVSRDAVQRLESSVAVIYHDHEE